MHENDHSSQGSVDSVPDVLGNEEESNGEEVDPSQETPFSDSKEDMFVDAPEELNFETPSKEAPTDNDDNVEIGEQFEKERDALERELLRFQEQFRLLTGENDLKGEDGSSLHEVVSRFSKFLEKSKEEQIQHENVVRELQGIINGKDLEIADLTTKISELSSSVSADSPDLSLVSKLGYQTEEEFEAVADRMLYTFSALFGQEELLSGSSISEKLTHVESRVSFLSAKYSDFYYGVDQLRKCLTSNVSEFILEDDFGSALGSACSELLELRQKESFLSDTVSRLEDENRKLVEQVEKDREMIESMNTEFRKLRAEVDQEKTKCANTKEKLSMAVTKGKALVQTRDALKQQLSEKTTELENRLTEVNELKNALETVELVKGQLEQSLIEKTDELEKCTSKLNEISLSLEKCTSKLNEISLSLEETRQTKYELDQSLAGKTKELEDCYMKLQEMSSALDTSELIKGELVKLEAIIASHQEMISLKSSVIENIEAILSPNDTDNQFQSLDIIEKVRSLAAERNELRDISQEYNRLEDFTFSIDLPEAISHSSLEVRLNWLRESFLEAKGQVSTLQNQIENLSSSLSAEIEDKYTIQKELDDTASRLKEIEENVDRLSLEKVEIVRRLVETSGVMTGVEHCTSSDINLLVDRSFETIEKKIRDSIDNSHGDEELFERFQCLLYVREVESSLCEEILREEIQISSSNQLNEINVVNQELASMKDEKSVLETELERSNEKSAMLREKLSMAIKKGKGLVQDREKMKNQLDEKNSEVSKLTLELQQLGSTVESYTNQMNVLSGELDRIKELETELTDVKEERDKLNHSLSEKDAMLQRVMKSIDTITIPVDSAVEKEPSEKIELLAGYLKEEQLARIKEQEEMENIKEEVSTLANKLAETQAAMKLVEDALSTAEGNIDRLSEENKQVQAAKENIELELQKTIEDASSLGRKLDEAFSTKETLEAALMQAERNISDIISEKEEAQSIAVTAQGELEKVREEASVHINKLTDAESTIKSLESALSHSENNIELFSKQVDDRNTFSSNLENELKKLKEEAEFQYSKMTDASMTIKSLEESLMAAENGLSALQDEKVKAEGEILTLSSKLNACMEELAGSSGKNQINSLELFGHLDNLQLLLKDEGLVSRVNEYLDRKFRSLKDMEFILGDILRNFAVKGLAEEIVGNGIEDDLILEKSLLNGLGESLNSEMKNSQENEAVEDHISSCLMKIADEVKQRNRILEKNFESFSTSIDTIVVALIKNLTAARDQVINALEHNESLKEQVKSTEIIVCEHENTIARLQSDVSALMAACGEAVRKLQLDVKKDLVEPVQFQENVFGSETESTEYPQSLDVGDCAQRVKELSSAIETTSNATVVVISDMENKLKEASVTLEKVMLERDLSQDMVSTLEAKVESTESLCRDLNLQLEDLRAKEEKWHERETTSNATAVLIRDMENKLKEASITLENVMLERDLSHNMVSTLEAKVGSAEALCRDLNLQLEDLRAKEEKWHEREMELSSLYKEQLMKEQEMNETLSVSDTKALFEKINGIELPSVLPVNGVDQQFPYDVKKLFAIVDYVTEMQNQIDFLSYDKKELDSTLAEKDLEIQGLKELAEAKSTAEPEWEKAKNDMPELISSLEKLLGMFGVDDLQLEPKFSEPWALLQALESQINSLLLESDSSKSKALELSVKLASSQKLVDELSNKAKIFEEKLQSKVDQPDIIQDRSIPPRAPSTSEISEIDSLGLLGKTSTISPVASAAQVRTIRKGSTDHLAINIDSDSEHLLKDKETDEDKGHVFKSLNMSGMIPKQGKMIADRVDGIWVSGGRILMNRPRARIGLIMYSLLLHLWLLASIF